MPRGSAATYPIKYEIDEIELARISKLARLQLDDAKADLDKAKGLRECTIVFENSSDEEQITVQPSRSQGFAVHARGPSK